jgi:hypothetical protein
MSDMRRALALPLAIVFPGANWPPADRPSDTVFTVVPFLEGVGLVVVRVMGCLLVSWCA